MRTVRTIFIFLLLSRLTPLSFSQNEVRTGSINGAIYLRDGKPAPFVEVRLEGTTTGTQASEITDDQGRFKFPGLLAGKMYTLTIDVHGYQPIRRSIDLSLGRDYESLTLQPDPAYQTSDLVPKGVNPVVNARLAQIPDAARSEFEDGRKALNQKALADAISHFEKAIAIYPRYAEAYQLMGLAQLQSRQGLLAEQSLQKAVEIEEKLANAQYLLGVVRALLGRADQAEAPLHRFLELDPENPDGYFELSKVEFALQKFAESETMARRSILCKESNPGVHMVLAYALLRQHKAEQAKQEFRAYIELDPNSPAAADIKNTIALIEQHEKGIPN